jgi:hypothetical protein
MTITGAELGVGGGATRTPDAPETTGTRKIAARMSNKKSTIFFIKFKRGILYERE